MRTLAVVAFLAAMCAIVQATFVSRSATAYWNSTHGYWLQFDTVDPENGLAWGAFSSTVNTTGWSALYVNFTTNSAYSPEQRWYAAGYLEGSLTYEGIYDYYQDLYADSLQQYTHKQLAPLYAFINKNDQWIAQQIARTDHKGFAAAYWRQVGLVMQQFQGLVDGHNAYAPNHMRLSRLQILLSNLDGDLFDLVPALVPGADDEGDSSIAAAELHSLRYERKYIPPHHGHCTAFVRFTGDELYCAHNTWDDFELIVRIFKRYNFPASLEETEVAATEVLFSSYPGSLGSEDDFYVLNSNLFVTETTNDNFREALYKRIVPNTVPSWIRVIVANRLAPNAKRWTEIYIMHNSGTYNNQWVVVDHNLFEPGMKELANDTVWVIEQMPGDYKSADMTHIVNRDGYWGSYNVPYFPYIFNQLGYPWAVKHYGPEYSQNCSRANIFRRDATSVKSLADVQHIMQYNGYQTDPLTSGDPCNSIAGRCDLSKSDPGAFGAYDAKVTTHAMMRRMQAWGISGPTHQNIPPFSWSSSKWRKHTHLGQPDLYDFDWVLFQ